MKKIGFWDLAVMWFYIAALPKRCLAKACRSIWSLTQEFLKNNMNPEVRCHAEQI
jgi:hypothetical protein